MTEAEIASLVTDEARQRIGTAAYVSWAVERDLLQFALRQGISTPSGKEIVARVCANQGCVLESQIVEEIHALLTSMMEDNLQIDADAFATALSQTQDLVQGTLSADECKRKLIEIIEEKGYNTTKGWFSDWYGRIRKQLAN